jgi:hypothetical protein
MNLKSASTPGLQLGCRGSGLADRLQMSSRDVLGMLALFYQIMPLVGLGFMSVEKHL